MLTNAVLPLLLAVLLTVSGCSSERLSEDRISEVDEVVRRLSQCAHLPGLSLTLVKVNGERGRADHVTRHYGVLDVDSQRPTDEHTRFCVGSLTTGFTAALLTLLLQRNATYNLDSLVTDILGDDFRLHSAELTAKTSIRDILAHRVGVAKHFGAFLLGYNFTRSQILRRVRYLPQVKEFRSSKIFNNFLYVVAGALVEKLAQVNAKNHATWWENQLLEHVLKPLKMDATTFADRVPDWSSNFAVPHASLNGTLVKLRAKITGNILRPVGPSGSMCTTAEDMSKWLKALLNANDSDQASLFDESFTNQLFTISNHFSNATDKTAESLPVESTADGYGLGWTIGKYRGLKRAFHSSFSNYYYSMVSVLPESGIGIFSAVNGPHLLKCDNAIKALHYYLMDVALGREPWLSNATICSYPQRFTRGPNAAPPKRRRKLRRPKRSLTNSNWTNYEGVYENPFFGTITLSFNRSADRLQLNYGYYGKAHLEPITKQVFQMTFFGSIWYQSQSDDMKLFAKKSMLNVQFAQFSASTKSPQKLVVYLFDTEFPPVFQRV